MDGELQTLLAEFGKVWAATLTQARLMLLPSRLAQVAILLICLAVSRWLSRWLGQKMHDWMRSLEGRPLWQLRTLLVIHSRLWLIFFVILAWGA